VQTTFFTISWRIPDPGRLPDSTRGGGGGKGKRRNHIFDRAERGQLIRRKYLQSARTYISYAGNFDSKVFKKWEEERRVGSTSNATSKRIEKLSPKLRFACDRRPRPLCGSSIFPKWVPEPLRPLSVIVKHERRGEGRGPVIPV